MSNQSDKAILNSIFNPLSPLGEIVYEDELPPTLTDPIEEDNEINREIKNLELEGIQLAESGSINKAIEIFSNAILKSPNKASLYNNRAQAYRILGNIQGSMNDLEKAIELSDEKGRTGCQALCQRGLLNRRAGKDEEARGDFEKAAKLGSGFARTQLVALNPYAALCNQMLSKIMELPH